VFCTFSLKFSKLHKFLCVIQPISVNTNHFSRRITHVSYNQQSDSQFISSVAWNLHACWQKCIWSLSEWIYEGGFCGNIKFCVWWILKQFLWLVDLYSRCQILPTAIAEKHMNHTCNVFSYSAIQDYRKRLMRNEKKVL
jgi:hypothetical protein